MNDHHPDYMAAVEYLSRDPHANRELLVALHYEPLSAIRVARNGRTVVGALVRGPGPTEPYPEWIRLDADNQAAAAALVGPDDMSGGEVLSLHRLWLGDFAVQRYGIVPTGGGVYGYLLDRERLVRQPGFAVQSLTPDDIGLVERSACGWSRSYFSGLFREQRRPWAIINDGVIVCRASSGYRHANTEEVVGVWTHERWRGRGLARALVAAVADDILQRAEFVAYTTTFDNRASQAVAQSVGFRLCFAAHSYARPRRHNTKATLR